VVVHAADWVNVIALTPDDQVVLIEQYRDGLDRIALEIPGGMIDPGESPEQAGVRELREESGFAGDSVELLGMVHPNPAFMTNRAYTVLVRGAREVGELQQDEGEDIAVRVVPFADIPELVRSGAISHTLVIAAFYLLNLQPK
jgi:8-oxo-dGTP pyrophosphatase MutT (NUDIX family)